MGRAEASFSPVFSSAFPAAAACIVSCLFRTGRTRSSAREIPSGLPSVSSERPPHTDAMSFIESGPNAAAAAAAAANLAAASLYLPSECSTCPSA